MVSKTIYISYGIDLQEKSQVPVCKSFLNFVKEVRNA